MHALVNPNECSPKPNPNQKLTVAANVCNDLQPGGKKAGKKRVVGLLGVFGNDGDSLYLNFILVLVVKNKRNNKRPREEVKQVLERQTTSTISRHRLIINKSHHEDA